MPRFKKIRRVEIFRLKLQSIEKSTGQDKS